MKNLIWKISMRNLLKSKVTFSICVLGLSLGFTAFILVSLFIQYELSWDKANVNYDRIYRVQRHFAGIAFAMDGNDISPHSRAITAPLLEEFPEFEKVSVIRENLGKFLSATPDKLFFDESGICADHNYFDIFSYNFIEGTQHLALNEPFSIVLSETLANKLFSENALGQTVTLEKKFEFKVTGIYEDLPLNSSIRPAYIISFSTLERTSNISRDDLWSGDCMNFVLLKPGVKPGAVNDKIRNLFAGFQRLELEELHLCPLSKIHVSFNGQKDYYFMIAMLACIGLFILVMSAANYINLTIVNASSRGKEIALKKISGGKKSSVIFQFLNESLVISLLSLGISFILAQNILPLYNSIFISSLDISFISDWKLILICFFVALFIGAISGMFPAMFISLPNTVDLFKNNFISPANKKFGIKDVLVLVQFTISIILICLSLFFITQINFMTNKDLGFDKENILYARISSSEQNLYFEELRDHFLQYPEILNASMSTSLPFTDFGGGTINWEGAADDEKISYRPNRVTYDYIANMGISIIDGRDFSRDFTSDINQSCIINQSALRCFGWESPIGKRVNNNMWTVVGVVRDFHYKDMHNGIEPAVLILSDNHISGERSFAFRYAPGSKDKVKQILEMEFSGYFPSDPFEFHELDQTFHNESVIQIYQSFKKALLFFTTFSIVLAAIGLYGLVSFTTLQRTKEMGIRKINGCSLRLIFFILNKRFLTLLALSLSISWPAVWILHNAFPGANKIPLHIWILLSSALVLLFIILISTSYLTFKTATRNPVEALRYE
jgi:putative ABC transport system permease protein